MDHEIDSYLPAIYEVFQDLTKEELVKRMVSVEFNRFLSYYKSKRDLSSQGGDRERSSEPREIRAGDPVRYFINIGARDDFDWMQLKDFLKETLDLGRDDVFKVDVKEGFSFFNTDGEHTAKVMEVLNGYELHGRRINVEISKNDGGSNSSRRDHNGRGGERRSFGGGRDEIPEAETVTEHHVVTEVLVAKVVLEAKNVRTEEVVRMTEHQETKDAAVQLHVVLTQAHLEKEDQEEANSFC